MNQKKTILEIKKIHCNIIIIKKRGDDEGKTWHVYKNSNFPFLASTSCCQLLRKKDKTFRSHHFSPHRGDKRQLILSLMFQSILKRILNKMNTWHKTNVCEIKLKQQLVHNSNNYNIILFYIENKHESSEWVCIHTFYDWFTTSLTWF